MITIYTLCIIIKKKKKIKSQITAAQPQLNLPSDVVFFFSVACSSQHAGAFTEVTHKVVTEVEGHCSLISMQPPIQHTTYKSDTHCLISNIISETYNRSSHGAGNLSHMISAHI